MRNYLTMMVLLGLTTIVRANPGPAERQKATAEYIQSTGEIIVSANEVTVWYLQSASEGLTGAEPVGIPIAGALLTNTNGRIGEVSLGFLTFTNVNLGPVAAENLTCDDLTIYWGSGLGRPIESQSVNCTVPEPGVTILAAFGILCLLSLHRHDQISCSNKWHSCHCRRAFD